MSTNRIAVSFDTDADGFISRTCPNCRTRFKVGVISGQTSVTYCPFCGNRAERWETAEQLEYAKSFAARQLLQPALDNLHHAFEGMRGKGAGRATSAGKARINVPPKPVETDQFVERTSFNCCNRVVRHDSSSTPRYCLVCGGGPTQT
jgi:hypothetical protein